MDGRHQYSRTVQVVRYVGISTKACIGGEQRQEIGTPYPSVQQAVFT
jgi:hypothetical protein